MTKSYEIKKVDAGFDWGSIPRINIDTAYFETPDTINAHAQICYNDEAILVHLETEEKDIRAVEKGPLGSPCEDSCLEFFFCPMEGDARYFNFEFNSNCCMFLGIGSNVEDLVRLLVEPEIFSPEIKKTTNGWEIYYSIPYSFIKRFFPGFEMKEGKIIRANCFKCADCSNPPHYLSWSPVNVSPFTFHCQECFGIMTLKK